MATVSIERALQIGLQQHQAGRLAEAESLYRQIVAVQPEHADAWHLLGLVALQTGHNDAALELIQRAIALKPASYHYHNNLANTLKNLGRFDEAIVAYRRVLQDKPDLPEGYNNLGNAFLSMRQFDQAISALRRAIELKPNYAMAHNNLGTALLGVGRVDEAIAAFCQAIHLEPRLGLAHNNLGNGLKSKGQLAKASTEYRRAIECQPDLAMAHNNLGSLLLDQGQVDQAIVHLQRAVELQPGDAAIFSNLLVALHYQPQMTLAGLFDLHREFNSRHAVPLRAAWRPHQNSCDPDRPLRLGFVSPHFASHPVGRFLIRLLENLDPRRFECICYSDTLVTDPMTTRIRAVSSIWREISTMKDAQVSDQIRDDRVDILFDLAGHTAGNRLLVFARKPAPIQMTWLDYVGTTGLAAVDYILADPQQIPPGSEAYYCEKVLRLPDDYICYDPPADAPQVGSLPVLVNGHLTFGSFNVLPKIALQMVGVWASILCRVPHARLILKNKGWDDPATSTRFLRMFLDRGVAANRVELLGWSPSHEVLASYNRVDIALDTFPYNGGLTTCEAIWMGVPVITHPGQTFASRHGLTHLTSAGLTETIADTLDQYVDIAVALATDLPRLAGLRAGMRQRVADSALCNGKKFADHFANRLNDVWRQHCVAVGIESRSTDATTTACHDP